jgi:site-specific recombinase XerC
MKPSSFASLLHAFFHEWMGKQRNLSHHTVCSYRDTWKMFLQFTASRRRRQITQLSLADLQASEVRAFLDYLEEDGKVSIGTRNCRLAAIHSFFTFVAHREPLAIAQCAEIAYIPVKKTSRPACVTWMPRRSRRSFESPINRAWKDRGITRCSRSCTTREHESRKRWMCARGPSDLNPSLR